MGNDELTIEILKQIRDEAKRTNERLDTTNERLDTTNERLKTTNERLDRVVREQIRHATAIVSLEKSLGDESTRDLQKALTVVTRELRGTRK